MFHRYLKIGCVAAFVGLSGCANVRGITSDVSSFSSWPSGRAPGSYAFERLPSQVQQAAAQDELEQAARGALTDAGFTEGKLDTADFKVQLGSRVGYSSGYPGTGVGVFGGVGSGGRGGGFSALGIGLNFGGGGSGGDFDREVSIVIRDGKTGQTLYESKAHNDGSGSRNGRVEEAMFAAALKDFPNPAVNPRRVVIDDR